MNFVFKLSAIVALVLLSSCSQSTSIRVTKPAEIDVSGIQRIAIMDFRGPGHAGRSVSASFVSKLFATEFYTIVERAELEKVLEEHALSMSGVIDLETAVEAGNILGVQGVILGDVVSYRCEDRRGTKTETREVWTGEYERNENGEIVYEKNLFGKKEKKKKYKEELVEVDVVDREANVTLSFRLVEVNTASILATRQASHSRSNSIEVGEGSLPPRDEILTALTDACTAEFTRLLAPHEVNVNVKFAKGDDAVAAGIKFAERELWDRAIAAWQGVLAIDPANHAAIYNIGVAHEASGAYALAEEAYGKAADIKPEGLYLDALKRIRATRQDQEVLQEQIRQQGEGDF